MHLTRPKSSKRHNRSKPTRSHTSHLHMDDFQNTPMTPMPPPMMGYERSDRCLRSHSLLRQNSQLSADEVTDLLQTVPAVPSLSLNKYKPLPSIEKKPSEDDSLRGMEEKTSKLSLSDNLIVQARRKHRLSSVNIQAASRSNAEMGNVSEVHCKVCPKPLDPGVMTTETENPSVFPPAGQPGLLLAIRVPCGRRFQQDFLPTDTLLMVRATAEARYGTLYEYGIIETMDVPRRTFTDLNLTLAQCDILNRSLLCISQEDSSMDSA